MLKSNLMSEKINGKIYKRDDINSQQEVLIRRMFYADPGAILSEFNTDVLKEFFLNNINRLKGKIGVFGN